MYEYNAVWSSTKFDRIYIFFTTLHFTHNTHIRVCSLLMTNFIWEEKRTFCSTMEYRYQPFKMGYRWALNSTFNRRLDTHTYTEYDDEKIKEKKNEEKTERTEKYCLIEFIYSLRKKNKVKSKTLCVSAQCS